MKVSPSDLSIAREHLEDDRDAYDADEACYQSLERAIQWINQCIARMKTHD